MYRILMSTCIMIMFISTSWGLALEMGKAFAYHGQLLENGNLTEGLFDFRFSLYDSLSAGNQIGGTITLTQVQVTDSDFVVDLDFGNVFTGQACWLEIEVRPTMTGGYTKLTPRHPINPTPYALYAATAGSVLNGAGLQGSGTAYYLPKFSNANTLSNSVLFESGGKIGLGTTQPAHLLDIQANTAFVSIDGRNGLSGYRIDENGQRRWILFFRQWQGDNLIVRDEAGLRDTMTFESLTGCVGIGVNDPTERLEVAGTIYSSSGGFKFPDGSIQTTAVGGGSGLTLPYNETVSSGAAAFEIGNTGAGAGIKATVSANYQNALAGHASGQYGYGVYGINETTGNRGWIGGNAGGVYGVSGRPGSSQNRGYLGRSDAGAYGFADYGTGVHGESANGTGVYAATAVGEAVLAESSNGIGVKAEGTSYAVHARATTANGTGLFAMGGADGNAADLRGNVRIFSHATNALVVEIGEGLDYAEGFDVAAPEEITPGTVLVIDPAHPGQLTVSSQPYDRKVAGIVAGANGLGSGVRLGAGQFDYDVALAGRVYCNVDATDAAIEPGDLLTSSSLKGYACKVEDYTRAQGAIIGKAMQPLAKGKTGSILVLVTLQ